VIRGPWNVNRGPWNMIMVPYDVIMGLWYVNRDSGMRIGDRVM